MKVHILQRFRFQGTGLDNREKRKHNRVGPRGKSLKWLHSTAVWLKAEGAVTVVDEEKCSHLDSKHGKRARETGNKGHGRMTRGVKNVRVTLWGVLG